MRYLSFFPFFVLLLLVFPSPSVPADLPTLSATIETPLYQGTAEEITAFTGKRQALIDGFIAEITTSIHGEKEEKSKAVLVALLDLFQGLSFQLKNLQAERARGDMPLMAAPSPGPLPYGLEVFDEIIVFQQKIAKQLEAYEESIAFGESRSAALRDELASLVPQYAQMKSEGAERFQLYEKLAYILSLQHEYALLQVKKPKLNKAVTEARGLARDAGKLAEKVFQQLQISKDDIAAQGKKLDQLNEHHAASLARLNAEHLDLSKQSVIAESKLDKIVSATAVEAREGAAAEQESEKARLELVLEAIRFRQQAIGQEKANLDLAVKEMGFRREWFTACVAMGKGENISDFVENWQKHGGELAVRKDVLIKELSEATQQRSDMAQRLVARSMKSGTARNDDFQALFSKQAEKTTANLDVLILGIADNLQDLGRLREEIDLVISLLRGRMDKTERFRAWGLSYLANKWEQIRAVLSYPLFSIGDISITLINIGKVVLLLLIGVRLLKVVQKKTANFLAERTAMTPGAVHSITTLVYYAALVVGLLVILSTIGFHVSQLGMIFGALSVGLGFGLQTISNNFISGIILLSEQTLQVGDYVELETGVTGQVRKISIRATIVRTLEGEDVIVPNAELVSNRVHTWSYGDNWRRLKVPFGVAYGSDVTDVVRLAEEAAREVSFTREDSKHPVRIFFEGFGNSSLDFSIRPWCWMNQIQPQSGMISDYYFALFRKFKEAGVEIPFPQTELHLKSVSPEVLAMLQQLVPERGAGGEEKMD